MLAIRELKFLHFLRGDDVEMKLETVPRSMLYDGVQERWLMRKTIPREDVKMSVKKSQVGRRRAMMTNLEKQG